MTCRHAMIGEVLSGKIVCRDCRQEFELRPRDESTCTWTIDDWDGDSCTDTSCGKAFCFETDPPHDWMKFCCYCGKPVRFALASAGHKDDE